jgi:hypothetical protein
MFFKVFDGIDVSDLSQRASWWNHYMLWNLKLHHSVLKQSPNACYSGLYGTQSFNSVFWKSLTMVSILPFRETKDSLQWFERDCHYFPVLPFMESEASSVCFECLTLVPNHTPTQNTMLHNIPFKLLYFNDIPL